MPEDQDRNTHTFAGRALVEAYRRIEICKDGELKLGGIPGLETIPADLCELLPDLKSLDISDSAITKIGPVTGLKRLQRLVLVRTAVTDLSPLEALSSLTHLDLEGAKVKTLESLVRCPSKLVFLDITDVRLKSIEPLEHLRSLRNLRVGGSDQDRRYEHLLPLTNLRTLRIDGYGPVDCAVIVKLKNLASLALLYSGTQNFDAISEMENLESFTSESSDVDSLTAFSSLGKLKALHIEREPVSDLSPLASIKTLEMLTLENCPVTDLGPIRDLHLTHLDLTGTGVRDLTPLSEMLSLRRLVLDQSPVQDLRALSRLENLVLAAESERGRRAKREGLSFRECPIDDHEIEVLARFGQPQRTRRTINYLRRLEGLPPVGNWEADEDADESSALDQALELPKQTPDAPQFVITGQQVDVEASELGNDAVSVARAELAIKASELKSLCAPGPGYDLVAPLASVLDRLVEALNDPKAPTFRIWSPGNTLRRHVSADHYRASLPDHDRDRPPFPTGVGQALNDVVETFNVWCSLDDEAHGYDLRRPSPSDVQEAISTTGAGRDLANRIRESKVLTSRATAVVVTAFEAASQIEAATSLAAAQDRVLARDTGINAIAAIMGKTLADIGQAFRPGGETAARQGSAIKVLEAHQKQGTFSEAFKARMGENVADGVTKMAKYVAASAAAGFILMYWQPILAFLGSNPAVANLAALIRALVGAFG